MKEKQRIYSYRKFKGIGLASAVVGMTIFGATFHVPHVQAESVTEHSDSLEDKPDKIVLKDTESSEQPSTVSGETQPINVTDSERTDHGKLIETDDSAFGGIGEMYEDGTYIMKSKPGENVSLKNPNGGVGTMFWADGAKLDKIKNFVVGNPLVADRFDLGSYTNFRKIDLTGLTLTDKSEIPFLVYLSDKLTELKFDERFKWKSNASVTRFIDGAPNLELTNEQVTQLLSNLALTTKQYNGPLFRNVGVERLDLSTFDNSKIDPTKYEKYSGVDEQSKLFDTKSVFKDLIGLKEVVFGDKFDFEKYARKNTTDAFMDTDLSGVEKVTFAGNKPSNDKFVKDWLGDVQKLNDTNKQGLYRDGQYVGSVTDALNATEKTYEDGVYTLGPISTPRPEKPADKVSTEVIEPVVEYVGDTNQARGYESRAEGSKGSKTVTTTYEWDDATNSYKEKVLEPFIKEGGKTVVTVGTKPKVVTEVLEPTVVYEKDDTREFGAANQTTTGSKGSKVTTTTYTVDKNTGKVTEQVGEPVITNAGVSKVTVATKPTIVQYKDAQGRNVIETTTYTVDKDTGNVTPTTVKTYGTTKEPTVEKRVVEPAVVYEADKTREYGASNDRVEGQAGEETVTTTYTVDSNSGEIKSVVGQPVRTKEPINTVVKVAAKDKVVTEVLEPTVVYEKDDTREFGTENHTTVGSRGSKVTTTTYTVDKNTGKVTETVGEPVITKAGASKVAIATKPTVMVLKTDGKMIQRTTTYSVNHDTGEITSHMDEKLISDNGGTIPAPTVEIPEYTKPIGGAGLDGQGNTIPAPTVEIPEYIDSEQPQTLKPVLPAPSVDKPMFNGPIEPSVERKVIPAGKRYEKDDSREKGQPDQVIKGKDGSIVTTTTFTVDKDGNVLATNSEPVRDEPVAEVIKVAAKDKVETKVVESPKRYVGDDTKELGYESGVFGKDGEVHIRTIYDVNPETGDITERTEKELSIVPTETVITKGMKPSVKTVERYGKVYEQTTTYTVNEKTGELSSSTTEKFIKDVENPVVKPVDKPEVEPVVEQTEKPAEKTEQKQLPNTGDAGTLASLAGLGIGLLGAGLSRKREE